MTLRNQRRFAVRAALTTALMAGASLVVAGANVAHATATNAGTLTVKVGSAVASSGSKTTAFSLNATSGAACSGDTVSGGYKVTGFIAPVAQDLAALTLTAGQWNQVGVNNLYDNTGTPFVNANTAVSTGFINGAGLPVYDLNLFDSTTLPAGTYRFGYACTKGVASATQLDKYWSVVINVNASQAWTVPTVPSAPATPEVYSRTGGSVTVEWNAPADGGLALSGYDVEASTDGGTTWTLSVHTDAATTSATFDGLTAATSYKFRVKANNLLGASAASTVLTASTGALSAPGAVTDAAATPLAGGTSVSLTWSAPANTGGAALIGYGVFYNTGSSWKYALSASTSVTLTGLAKNTAYNFTVVASNGTYLSPVLISATASATTLSTVAGAPSKPVLTAGVKKVTVKWSAPADNGGRAITAYRIQRSTNGTTWTTLTSAGSASTRTYVATGLTTGVKYYFRVAAINPVGTSAYSAVNSVKAG
jgi:hypothetical protein